MDTLRVKPPGSAHHDDMSPTMAHQPPAGSKPAGGLSHTGGLPHPRPEGELPDPKGLRKILVRSTEGS
jgi:hypothetical protein